MAAGAAVADTHGTLADRHTRSLAAIASLDAVLPVEEPAAAPRRASRPAPRAGGRLGPAAAPTADVPEVKPSPALLVAEIECALEGLRVWSAAVQARVAGLGSATDQAAASLMAALTTASLALAPSTGGSATPLAFEALAQAMARAWGAAQEEQGGLRAAVQAVGPPPSRVVASTARYALALLRSVASDLEGSRRRADALNTLVARQQPYVAVPCPDSSQLASLEAAMIAEQVVGPDVWIVDLHRTSWTERLLTWPSARGGCVGRRGRARTPSRAWMSCSSAWQRCRPGWPLGGTRWIRLQLHW